MKKTLIFIGLVIIVSLPSQAVFSQTKYLTYTEMLAVESSFQKQYDKITQDSSTHRWGNLSPDTVLEFKDLSGRILTLLEAGSNKSLSRKERDLLNNLFYWIRDFNLYVNEIYKGVENLPEAIFLKRNEIDDAFGNVLESEIKEFERRFETKYGKLSERLNCLEIVMLNILSPTPKGHKINPPSPFEPILRANVLGFQWYTNNNALKPASPIYQAGLSYYLFGDSKLSGLINHIGIAGAYQRDLITKRNLWGAVLHLRTYDAGILYDLKSKDYVVSGSVNFQIFKNIF